MKTAMQELIERLDKTERQLDSENNLIMSAALFAAKSMALELLEKEKSQIEHAHAHHRCVNDKTMECTIKAYENAEQYYNQTYKPETI